MAKAPTNMAKSVKDRLLNIARKEGRAFDILLVRFALERLLYRLSISSHRDRFVLKGGMLVTVWVADDNRVTRDADFLGHGDADPDRLVADFGEIMAIGSDDGLAFDIDALAATVIREEMEYGGIRLKTAAYLERTRIPVTIDIGFGDAMADATQRLDLVGSSRSASSFLSARHRDRREIPGDGSAWRPQRTYEGLLRSVGDPARDRHFRWRPGCGHPRDLRAPPDADPERTSTRPLGRDVWRRRETTAMACLRRVARTRRCFAGIGHRRGMGAGRSVMRADRSKKRE